MEELRKDYPTPYYLQETHFNYNGIGRFKVKAWKKDNTM